MPEAADATAEAEVGAEVGTAAAIAVGAAVVAEAAGNRFKTPEGDGLATAGKVVVLRCWRLRVKN